MRTDGDTDMLILMDGFRNFFFRASLKKNWRWTEGVVKQSGVPFWYFTARNEEKHGETWGMVTRVPNHCSVYIVLLYVCCRIDVLIKTETKTGRKQPEDMLPLTGSYIFRMWIESIATDVDIPRPNKHHYIYKWSVSLPVFQTSVLHIIE